MRAVIVSLVLGLSACSAVHAIDKRGVELIKIKAFERADGARFVTQLKDRGVIVELPKGTLIPVKLNVNLTVADLLTEGAQLMVRLNRRMYVYAGPQGAKISPDGERWIDLGRRGVKRLFGLKQRGSFQIGFGMKKGEPFSLTVALRQL
ncbi:MAG: hypothetical protein H6707_06030 [Deltaproteobacteria bacterium]|nr:hypothetical protein [Deltaproteobacteria bacterium]